MPPLQSTPVTEFQCHHADCLRRFARKTSLTNHLKAHQNVRSRSIYRTKRARLRAAAAMQAAAAHAAHLANTSAPNVHSSPAFPPTSQPQLHLVPGSPASQYIVASPVPPSAAQSSSASQPSQPSPLPQPPLPPSSRPGLTAAAAGAAAAAVAVGFLPAHPAEDTSPVHAEHEGPVSPLEMSALPPGTEDEIVRETAGEGGTHQRNTRVLPGEMATSLVSPGSQSTHAPDNVEVLLNKGLDLVPQWGLVGETDPVGGYPPEILPPFGSKEGDGEVLGQVPFMFIDHMDAMNPYDFLGNLGDN